MKFVTLLLCMSLLLPGSAASAAAPTGAQAAAATTGTIPTIDRNGGYEVETEEVWIESDAGRIYAVLYHPKGAEGPRPAIIFAHGIGDTNRGGASYGQAFAKEGYLVCCFDFRGGSMSSKSEGEMVDMTVFTEKEDMEAVMAAMQKRDDVDANNIFLMGHSMGGVVATLAAADLQDEIAGLVLAAPGFAIVESIRAYFKSEDEIPDSFNLFIVNLGKAFFTSVYNYDLEATMRSYEGDVIIFHGDQDFMADISYSKKAVEEFPHATLEVIPGGSHAFSGTTLQGVVVTMGDFFESHLRGSRTQGTLVKNQIFNGADGPIHYSYYLPAGYSKNQTYPMMLALPGYNGLWSGDGSAGNNLNWEGVQAWQKLDEPMIVVSPQMTDWGEKSARQANELAEYFLKNFPVNKNRVYAAGYSAGGETMSRAVSMRPDLYAAYIHGSSLWDGTYAPLAENRVGVYIFAAESDEYYGSKAARDAYNKLVEAYRASGMTDTEINKLLRLQIPNDSYFNKLGITNYHAGGSVLFSEAALQNWTLSMHKGTVATGLTITPDSGKAYLRLRGKWANEQTKTLVVKDGNGAVVPNSDLTWSVTGASNYGFAQNCVSVDATGTVKVLRSGVCDIQGVYNGTTVKMTVVVPGDYTRDGKVSTQDVTECIDVALQDRTLDTRPYSLELLDFSQNGVIDTQDLTTLIGISLEDFPIG